MKTIAWMILGLLAIIGVCCLISICASNAHAQTITIPPSVAAALSLSSNAPPLPPGYYAVHTRTECVETFLTLSGFTPTGAGVIVALVMLVCHGIRNTALKDATHETSGIFAKVIGWVGMKPLDKFSPLVNLQATLVNLQATRQPDQPPAAFIPKPAGT